MEAPSVTLAFCFWSGFGNSGARFAFWFYRKETIEHGAGNAGEVTAGAGDALAAGDKAEPNKVEKLSVGGVANDAAENAYALFFFAIDATSHCGGDGGPGEHGGIGGDEALFAEGRLDDGGLKKLGKGLQAAFMFELGEDGSEVGFPFAEKMREEILAILEMPIKAALGDAQVASQQFDADFGRTALEERQARGAEPVFFSEVVSHTVAYGTAPREACQYGGVW